MFIHLESGTCGSGYRILEINSLAAAYLGSSAYMIKAFEPWFRAGAPRQVAIFDDFDSERNSWRCSVSTKDGILAEMLACLRDGLPHQTFRSNVLYELQPQPSHPTKLDVRVSIRSPQPSHCDRDDACSIPEDIRECRFQSGFAQLVLKEL